MFYGLEMSASSLEANAASTNSSLPRGSALLDCGATASSGPEESVKNLLNAILTVDRGASVSIAKYMRPYFRFGNGKWGQANYKVSIASRVSGQPRSFHMYCLPNPPEFNEKGFDRSNMVPVLVGMDHLSGRSSPESALIIDFHTGLSVESMNPRPEVQQLPSNAKGHYVRDIVHYLTLGFSNPHGTPDVQRKVRSNPVNFKPSSSIRSSFTT